MAASSYPYTIEIRLEPSSCPVSKNWKKRVRNRVRDLVEHQWELTPFFDRPDEERESFENRWAGIAGNDPASLTGDFQAHFRDLADSPSFPVSVSIEVDPPSKCVVLRWITKQAEDQRRNAQKASLRNLQKILRMKRDRNRPPEWERYLQLRPHWPSKAESVLPLPDPDTVRAKPEVYKTLLAQLNQVSRMIPPTSALDVDTTTTATNPWAAVAHPNQSIVRALTDYLTLCLPASSA